MKIEGFPWTLVPMLASFAICFVLQFRLKNYVDREKVLALRDMSELYPNSIPPRKILNAAGQRLCIWFYGGIIGFMGFGILTFFLYGK
jgi:hypothetical protein